MCGRWGNAPAVHNLLQLSGRRMQLSGGRMQLSGGRMQLSGGRMQLSGGRTRTRTLDPLIKSRKVYPSYQGAFRHLACFSIIERPCGLGPVGMAR
jgi:hypothetical protein